MFSDKLLDISTNINTLSGVANWVTYNHSLLLLLKIWKETRFKFKNCNFKSYEWNNLYICKALIIKNFYLEHFRLKIIQFPMSNFKLV